jgi:hypothetical protein
MRETNTYLYIGPWLHGFCCMHILPCGRWIHCAGTR